MHKKNTELHCLVKTQRYQTYLFVQQCYWELYTILEPRMHYDMKPLIVTIAEIHILIVDVCVSESMF